MFKKIPWIITALFCSVIVFVSGFLSGFALSSSIKEVSALVEPGAGSIIYVHPELAELQNLTMEYLGERPYEPWEPALIVNDLGRNIVRVRFCADGSERMFNRDWFATYRLALKLASYDHCEGN